MKAISSAVCGAVVSAFSEVLNSTRSRGSPAGSSSSSSSPAAAATPSALPPPRR